MYVCMYSEILEDKVHGGSFQNSWVTVTFKPNPFNGLG